MAKPTLDREEILERNDRVDREVVAAYRKLEGELRSLGIRRKPSYSLEPPLGRHRVRSDNRIEATLNS